jgi:hypothetical protein
MVDKRKYTEDKKNDKGVTEWTVQSDHVQEVVEPTVEIGIETVRNLGNFCSLRLVSHRKGHDREVLIQEIGKDLVALKNEFEKRHGELFGNG